MRVLIAHSVTDRNDRTFFSAHGAFPVKEQDSFTGVHFDELSPWLSVAVHL